MARSPAFFAIFIVILARSAQGYYNYYDHYYAQSYLNEVEPETEAEARVILGTNAVSKVLASQATSLGIYFRNLTALVDLIDRSAGPVSFPQQIMISTTLATGRTIALVVAGAIHNYGLQSTSRTTREFFEQFNFYFNANSFGANVARNWRNHFTVLLGRFVYDSFVYGPFFTIRAILDFSPTDYINFVTSNTTTMTFVVGMFLETFGEVGIFLLWALVGNLGLVGNNPPPTGRSPRSIDDFENIGDVGRFIKDKFNDIMKDLKDKEGDPDGFHYRHTEL